MTTLVQDARFAIRMLIKEPGLALVAILTLGVAIGANTTIFSVVNSVILQPLPYRQPDDLVRLHSQFLGKDFQRFWISGPEYTELTQQTRSFESMTAWAEEGSPVTGGVEPVRVPGAYVVGPFFQTLGVEPQLGRVFSSEEDRPGDPTAVVLSHGLWQRAFGGDPEIIGRRIQVDATPVTVIGVMAEGFAFPTNETELWAPLGRDLTKENRGGHFLHVIARLKPGVSLAQARGDLDAFMAWQRERHKEMHPMTGPNHPVVVNSLYGETVASAKWSLYLLQGAVAFLLLIATANIASLLLARAEARNREIAIRAAVGAGRLRIVRQLLTESVVLGLLGAALGLGIAVWGIDLAVALLPEGAPRRNEIAIDGWVLAVGIGCSLGTSLLFGLAPALHARTDDLYHGLKEGGRTATGGARLRVRRALVVVEIALAVVLVIGCGLMLRSFSRVQEVELGYDPDGLITMQIELPEKNYPKWQSVVAAWERLSADVRALPGVEHATIMSGMPPDRKINANDIFFVGKPQDKDGPVWNIDYWQIIGEDYFDTMRVRRLSGRPIEGTTESILLVNESMARMFWPGQDPIGAVVAVTSNDKGPFQTIAGVVADVKQAGLDKPTGTEVYIPFRLAAADDDASGLVGLGLEPRRMYLAIRSNGDPRELVRSVRRVVTRFDPNLALSEIRTMDEILWQAIARPRFFAVLLGGFAGIALLLAAIGIFGVMSYSISQRTRELGIRMALGAPPASVRRMVLREGMLLVGLGLVLGVVAAVGLNVALSKVLGGMLFGVTALDPTTFAAVPVLVAVIGAIACWLPAARATRVDPILALRHD